MTLGERVKMIRKARGMTRKQLGVLMNLNCPESRIEEYESGKRVPKKAILSKIAKVLNVSENYLLTGKVDVATYDGLCESGIIYIVFEKILDEEGVVNLIDEILVMCKQFEIMMVFAKTKALLIEGEILKNEKMFIEPKKE